MCIRDSCYGTLWLGSYFTLLYIVHSLVLLVHLRWQVGFTKSNKCLWCSVLLDNSQSVLHLNKIDMQRQLTNTVQHEHYIHTGNCHLINHNNTNDNISPVHTTVPNKLSRSFYSFNIASGTAMCSQQCILSDLTLSNGKGSSNFLYTRA